MLGAFCACAIPFLLKLFMKLNQFASANLPLDGCYGNTNYITDGWYRVYMCIKHISSSPVCNKSCTVFPLQGRNII